MCKFLAILAFIVVSVGAQTTCNAIGLLGRKYLTISRFLMEIVMTIHYFQNFQHQLVGYAQVATLSSLVETVVPVTKLSRVLTRQMPMVSMSALD